MRLLLSLAVALCAFPPEAFAALGGERAAPPAASAPAPLVVPAAASIPGVPQSLDAPSLNLTYDNAVPQAPAVLPVAAPLQAASPAEGPRLAASSPAPEAEKASTVPPAPNAPVPPQKPVSFLRAAAPNAVTTLNLLSGFAAILLGSSGMIAPAAGLILLANVFDAFDGRVARALGVSGSFGIEYDSLADVVSFGVAPAVLLAKTALSGFGVWGAAAAGAFAVAGALRLARFNVGAHAEKRGEVPLKKSDSFTGLPIPGGAGVAVAGLLAAPALGALAGPVLAGLSVLTAAAMVSTLPYPAFKKAGLKTLAAVGGGAAALVGGLAAAGLLPLAPAAIFGAYLASGPIKRLWSNGSEAFRREAKRKLFHQLHLLYLAPMLLMSPGHLRVALGLWFAGTAVIEALRLKSTRMRPLFDHYFGRMIRAKEEARPSGFFWSAAGLFAVGLLFAGHPALLAAAVLGLTLGDASSPLVGLRFGWKPYKVAGTQRSVDGTLAGFAVTAAIGLALGFSPVAALGAALAFSVVDTYPVKPDDNLWIPIVFSAALAVLGAF